MYVCMYVCKRGFRVHSGFGVRVLEFWGLGFRGVFAGLLFVKKKVFRGLFGPDRLEITGFDRVFHGFIGRVFILGFL